MAEPTGTSEPGPATPAVPKTEAQAMTEADPMLPKPEATAEAPKLHKVSRKSPFGALMSRTLPKYSGQYEVGVCDVEVPVEQQRTIGSFRHKMLDDQSGPTGLLLNTVLFSLFYPAEVQGKAAPIVWFPNLKQTIDGFLKMAKRTSWVYRMAAYPVAAAAIWGTTFPGHKDAPLLTPPDGKKWPLILFSHGVGCSRLMYSAFCGEMASRGYIVAALEHRDGTSPSTRIATADGSVKKLDWLQWSDLEWPDLKTQPTDDTMLRHDQIDFRCAEVVEVIRVMERISEGESITRLSITAPDFDWTRWKAVDSSRPVMSGHSLGGSCAFAVSARLQVPFRAVVAFDPATQRLAPWKSELPNPLLVVNSEEFAVGKEWKLFAEQIAGTVRPEPGPYVFTLPGATHPAFSDVFLILPNSIVRMTGMKASAERVIQLTVAATEDFLAGHPEKIEERAERYEAAPRGMAKVEGPDVNNHRADEVPIPTRKVGDPNKIVWHPFWPRGA